MLKRSSRAFPFSDDISVLREQHENLKTRLNQLDRQRSLSPTEQYERQVLKKRKLALKDRMLKIA